MTQRIVFLRAVNLGKRRVDMSRLKDVVDAAGYDDAWTFLNSGNVVVDAAGARERLEADLGGRFEDAFGFEITTFVRSIPELRTTLDAEPFTMSDGDTHFVTFLKRPATADQRHALEALSGDFDTLRVHGRDVHWHMKGRSSESPLVKRDWERILGPLTSTSRNVTMLRKLMGKVESRRRP